MAGDSLMTQAHRRRYFRNNRHFSFTYRGAMQIAVARWNKIMTHIRRFFHHNRFCDRLHLTCLRKNSDTDYLYSLQQNCDIVGDFPNTRDPVIDNFDQWEERHPGGEFTVKAVSLNLPKEKLRHRLLRFIGIK